jgi:hypothetical protein
LTFDPYAPSALEKTRIAASCNLHPVAAAWALAWARIGVIASGSSAMAAGCAASARQRDCIGSRSRKMPDGVISVSIRGRPSSSKGISSVPHGRA